MQDGGASDHRLAHVRSVLPLHDACMTIGQLAQQAEHAVPDRIALVFCDTDPDQPDRQWTYRELIIQVEAMARLLADRFAPGERLTVWAHNCPEWPMVQYAAALAGLVLVAVSPVATMHELDYVLAQSDASGLVVGRWTKGPDRVALAKDALARLESLRDVLVLEDMPALAGQSPSAKPLPYVDSDSPAMVQ